MRHSYPPFTPRFSSIEKARTLLAFLAARGGANDITKVMDYFRLLFGTGTSRQDHRALVPPKFRSSQEQAPLQV